MTCRNVSPPCAIAIRERKNVTDLPPPRRNGKPPVPVYQYENDEAEQAWLVYRELAMIAVTKPELAKLPLMIELRAIALERFHAAFEAL